MKSTSDYFIDTVMSMDVTNEKKFGMARKFADSGNASVINGAHALHTPDHTCIPLETVDGYKRVFRAVRKADEVGGLHYDIRIDRVQIWD